MGNIMDYISWRGDLTFAQSPFNEVDNLILACFSYVNLDRIPAVTRQKGIELKKLVKEFKKLHTIKELEADKSFIRLAPFMMFEMAESVRFGNCVIRNYVNEIVTEAEQQFSAVEIVLDDGTSYISFRGTDDTIIGWKEDFNLSTGVVPAQKRAVEYMQRISEVEILQFMALSCAKVCMIRFWKSIRTTGRDFQRNFRNLPRQQR